MPRIFSVLAIGQPEGLVSGVRDANTAQSPQAWTWLDRIRSDNPSHRNVLPNEPITGRVPSRARGAETRLQSVSKARHRSVS